jgi:peptidoglycan hydrolase-like protein with peptidoglycan-binding domain
MRRAPACAAALCLTLVWLLAMVALPGRLGAQLRPASSADTAFWDRVKDSANPEEIRAYLEAFPSGAYADLARTRLKEVAPSSSASPLPAAPPGASVLTTTDIIREVQERLYNLNYALTVTGFLDEETRTAVRAWQQVVNRPITGDMDADQLQLLRSAHMPSLWGALAFVARGNSAVVWSRSSRREAEHDAVAGCEQEGGRQCKVVTAAESWCGALGFFTGSVGRTTYWGAFPALAPTLGQAVEQALRICRQQAKRPDACGVRLTFCADGSHQR